MNSLKAKVAGLMMWGFNGQRLTPRLRRLLHRYPPAGVILFKRNIRSLSQIQALNAALKKVGPKLLIGVDQEGGRVARIHGLCEFPPAAVYGQVYQQQRGVHFVEAIARLMGWELRRLGFNLDFAPVLDVHSNPRNPIIGDRAFANDPQVVIKTAIPFYRGLLSEGIIPCGKHFPGHGDTQSDSHLELPEVDRSRSELYRTELAPFREAIRQGIPTLMTAHVVYRALDPDHPATLSKKIMTDLLRQELGFRGVLFSDDLFMKALAQHSLEESLALALEAGNDLFLLCRDFETRHEVVDSLTQLVSRSPALKCRVGQAFARVAQLKKKYLKKQ